MNEEYKKAYTYALRRLAAKSYFSKDLVNLMKQKGMPLPIITQVIEQCSKSGYLDDERWIQSYVAHCIAKKQGPKMIIAKLQQRGVERTIAASAVADYLPVNRQKETLQKLLESKYKKRNLSDPKERQKVVLSLARKGFSLDLIFEMLRG